MRPAKEILLGQARITHHRRVHHLLCAAGAGHFVPGRRAGGGVVWHAVYAGCEHCVFVAALLRCRSLMTQMQVDYSIFIAT